MCFSGFGAIIGVGAFVWAGLSESTRFLKDIIPLHAFGALLGMEGIEPIEATSFEESFALLRLFYRLGVRCVGLTWQSRNMAADGAEEERTNGGLSRFGIELVKEMEKMGIVIDLAHLSESSFYSLLGIVQKPVICSHACCRAL